jgi:GxxExxY protein
MFSDNPLELIMYRRKEKEEDQTTGHTKRIELKPDVVEKFREIVRMCESVYCALGKGFAESVYENALCIELQERGIQYTSQEVIPCTYKDRFIGNIRLDIVLHTWLPFIFELKAVGTSIQTDERWQLLRYMSRKGIVYGAVVNFTQSIRGNLELSFVIREDDGDFVYSLETGEGKRMRDACPRADS